VLLITAHPDDESLFFTPSILYHVGHPHVTRHLLVLSSGKTSTYFSYSTAFIKSAIKSANLTTYRKLQQHGLPAPHRDQSVLRHARHCRR
jgi:LmbE family N-acetylglucosaminyl deacetylase